MANLLGAGQRRRLWQPRRNFTGGGLQLNQSHFAYPFLVAAMGPTNGSGSTPPIFLGPQAPSTFPTTFTTTSGTIDAPTTNEYGAALSFNNASLIKTGNQTIFGGLTNFSFVGAFTPGAGNASGDCIVRKDAEFTPMQMASATTAQAGLWTSTFTVPVYPLSFATNDIVHCGLTIVGATQTMYQSVNRGAISTSTASNGNGIIASGSGTPLVLGASEGGANFFLGKMHFAYWFAKTALTADQIAQLFLDPAALFVVFPEDQFYEAPFSPVPDWPPAGPYGTPNLVQSTLRF